MKGAGQPGRLGPIRGARLDRFFLTVSNRAFRPDGFGSPAVNALSEEDIVHVMWLWPGTEAAAGQGRGISLGIGGGATEGRALNAANQPNM